MEDQTIIMLDVLGDVAESLYERLNSTREKQVLAVRGLLAKLEKKAAEEEAEFKTLAKSLDATRELLKTARTA